MQANLERHALANTHLVLIHNQDTETLQRVSLLRRLHPCGLTLQHKHHTLNAKASNTFVQNKRYDSLLKLHLFLC